MITYNFAPKWSDERTEQLKALWDEGLSASQIARAIGGISRSGVIGKVHRLGLPGRARTPRVATPRERHVRLIKAAIPLPPPAPIGPPLLLEDGSHVTVLTISDRMCRWPYGNPNEVDFHFCGRAPKFGRPYCEAHWSLAHSPAPKPRTEQTKADASETRLMMRAGLA